MVAGKMSKCEHNWVEDIQESITGKQSPVRYCEDCGKIDPRKKAGRPDMKMRIYREIVEVGYEITARDLSVRLNMSTNTVAYHLRGLCFKGLVEKEEPLRHLGQRCATVYKVI